MGLEFPESSNIEGGHKIEGPMKEARESFYELAKGKIKYLSKEEIKRWHEETTGRENHETMASYILSGSKKLSGEGDYEKWIDNLEIVVNTNVFTINGEDYSDLMPFFIEHELYEAWLSAKEGAASSLDVGRKHLLARRREFFFAAKQGLEDRHFEFHMLINPAIEEECKSALEYAKKRMRSI